VTDVHAIEVDESNAAQRAAWDGDEGAYWAEHADYFDRSVQAYHRPFLEAAAIAPADRVLDIGCGTGQTTRDAGRLAFDGTALGVDLSSAMIDQARRRALAEGLGNVTFLPADAQIHPFEPGGFDVAVSRTGAMFFGNPVAAFSNVRRALRPGGRLVLLAWQALPENEWVIEFFGALAAGRGLPSPPPGAPGPFSFGDPERVRSVLTTAGFTDIDVAATRAALWFGADADEAHRMVLGVLGWMLRDLDEAGRARAREALRATVSAHETAGGVLYQSAAWTVRATSGD